MSLTENILNQADDYLDGKLAFEESKAFELMLTNNQELLDYININKEMRVQYNNQDWLFVEDDTDIEVLEKYLKSDDAKKYKASILKVNADYINKSNSKKTSLITYFSIAASIVILLGYFIFNSEQTNIEIYSLYNDWSNLPSLTTRSDSDNDLLVKGEEAFLNKDFNSSKEFFEMYLNTGKSINSNVLLYLGISNLEIKNYEKALTNFDDLIESKSIDFSKGYWFKALTYLKMDDKVSSIRELSIIVKDSSNYNYNQAKKLLLELE